MESLITQFVRSVFWKRIKELLFPTTILEIVYIDLSGPMKTKGFYGERYFMILVDDISRMIWFAFLKEKYKAFDKFKIFKNRVENESRRILSV